LVSHANQRHRLNQMAQASAKHVAVLMGGWSAEREVSLRSGKACADALKRRGYRVTPLDVTRNVAADLTAAAPDVALNVLHGRPGEDGTLQGLLEILGIPYSHSGVMASAVAMQKDYAKALFRAAGVPVAEHLLAARAEAVKSHLMAPPYVIKPVAEGSSVGVFIVTRDHPHPPQELNRDDWTFGDKVMIERYIPGKELTCAVLGDRALDVIEIVPATQFYDYEAKYAAGGSKHVLPAQILPNVYQEVRRLALAAHSALGCRGVSRADFRYDDRGTGELVCLEVNTQPGMTETSLVPELAAYAGITFDELVQWMVEDASTNR
jgi:D-alanine-D-alanine ligase